MTGSFDAALDAAAAALKGAERITLINHFDADGIAACAILRAALERLGRACAVRAVPQLSAEEIGGLGDGFFVFVDIGAAHAAAIAARLPGRALIVDHHRGEERAGPNPWLHGLDGGRDACSATLAFLIARRLDAANADLAPLALVGIIADAQEKRGLHGPNADAVRTGEEAGLVAVEERLRLFGYERRGLVAMLIGSNDLRIPGVTGSAAGARKFLARLGIPLRDRQGRDTRYDDLEEDQRERLLRAGAEAATRRPAVAPHYLLVRERGLFRDARQYATLLNACGRLGRGELALAICGGDEEARRQAPGVLHEYRAALREAYEWQKRSPDVVRAPGYVLIDAGSRIPPSIMGTVCSMATRGGDVPEGVVVLGVADDGADAKVSLRVSGRDAPDLRDLLGSMLGGVEGSYGGHAQAAGAVIRAADKERFLANARTVLEGLRG